MPQGGYTETAALSHVDITCTLERIASLLTETGEEKIHSIDLANLILGSLVQGEVDILAKVVWTYPKFKQYIGSRPVFGEKVLIGTHSHFLTLEFLQSAHPMPSIPSIGESIKFRGRVLKRLAMSIGLPTRGSIHHGTNHPENRHQNMTCVETTSTNFYTGRTEKD